MGGVKGWREKNVEACAGGVHRWLSSKTMSRESKLRSGSGDPAGTVPKWQLPSTCSSRLLAARGLTCFGARIRHCSRDAGMRCASFSGVHAGGRARHDSGALEPHALHIVRLSSSFAPGLLLFHGSAASLVLTLPNLGRAAAFAVGKSLSLPSSAPITTTVAPTQGEWDAADSG